MSYRTGGSELEYDGRVAAKSGDTGDPAPGIGIATLSCLNCGATESLVYESSIAYVDAAGESAPIWEITYWCANCDSFYGHTSHLEPAERQLFRLEPPERNYTHCGRPMRDWAPPRGNSPRPEAETFVRCDCGFIFQLPC